MHHGTGIQAAPQSPIARLQPPQLHAWLVAAVALRVHVLSLGARAPEIGRRAMLALLDCEDLFRMPLKARCALRGCWCSEAIVRGL